MSPELEIFRHSPTGKAKSKNPIVFVHGAYTGAWCWNEHFLTWFADQGFETISFSLRGHGGSGGRALRSLASIDDYVEDLEEIVETLGKKPILIGHSSGGNVVFFCFSRCSGYRPSGPIHCCVSVLAVRCYRLTSPKMKA